MTECSAISELTAPRPTTKSTSHFGGNNGDEPGFGGKNDGCWPGTSKSRIAPPGGRWRTRPAGPATPARSGNRTPSLVVQISSNLSERMFLGTSRRALSFENTPRKNVSTSARSAEGGPDLVRTGASVEIFRKTQLAKRSARTPGVQRCGGNRSPCSIPERAMLKSTGLR
jgi:hypothetical protein